MPSFVQTDTEIKRNLVKNYIMRTCLVKNAYVGYFRICTFSNFSSKLILSLAYYFDFFLKIVFNIMFCPLDMT